MQEMEEERAKIQLKNAEAKAKAQGRLVPSQVDGMAVFTDWHNSTTSLGPEGEPPQLVSEGSITWCVCGVSYAVLHGCVCVCV